jgi:hypothetical protein
MPHPLRASACSLEQHGSSHPAGAGRQRPGNAHGRSKGREGEVQASDRYWVWINSCWSRWSFVGYSRFGYPLYRRYVSCY